MALDDAIKVEGLAELRAALRAFPAEVNREFNKDMRAAVEPARQAIEGRMASDISHMKDGSPWIAARTGTSLNYVYIVPNQRGSRGASASRKRPASKGELSRKRPNFAPLAMSKAYEPARTEMAAGVTVAAEAAIAKVVARMNG